MMACSIAACCGFCLAAISAMLRLSNKSTSVAFNPAPRILAITLMAVIESPPLLIKPVDTPRLSRSSKLAQMRCIAASTSSLGATWLLSSCAFSLASLLRSTFPLMVNGICSTTCQLAGCIYSGKVSVAFCLILSNSSLDNVR